MKGEGIHSKKLPARFCGCQNIRVHDCCKWTQGRVQQLVRAQAHPPLPTHSRGSHPTWVQPMGLHRSWPLVRTSDLIAAALLHRDLLADSQTLPPLPGFLSQVSSGGHSKVTSSISSSRHPNNLKSQPLSPRHPLAPSVLNFSPWHLLASNILFSYFVCLTCLLRNVRSMRAEVLPALLTAVSPVPRTVPDT